MRKIKTTKIWSNGIFQDATQLDLSIVNDNLINNVFFSYKLKNDNNENLIEGSLNMDSDDYKKWTGSNEEAFIWVAEKLNLELLPVIIEENEVIL